MSTFSTSRGITASPEEVFEAFRHGERLARWWGPEGFTNTFNVFEFEPGGRWSLVMHSPHGGNAVNESIFEEIVPMRRIVIRHISEPKYLLRIEMGASEIGTLVSWSQTFDDASVAERIAKIVVPANEQNLDKLTAEILRGRAE